jgi:hypothetical protein
MSTQLATLLTDLAVFLAALFLPMLILGVFMLFGQVWSFAIAAMGRRKPHA